MCVHGFQGKGYSPKFVANFWRVVDDLDADSAQIIVVQGTADDICQPCPNNQGALCADETKIRKLDDAYVATLEIKPGDTMSWAAARRLVAKKVTDKDFDENCAPCGWRKLGVCKEALHKLRKAAAAGTLALALALVCFSATSARAETEPSIPSRTESETAAPADVGTASTPAAVVAPEAATTLPAAAAPATVTAPSSAAAPATVTAPSSAAAPATVTAPSSAAAPATAATPTSVTVPAKKVTQAPVVTRDTGGFTTIDQLEQALLTDKSKRVPVLFKIQNALNARDWKRAVTAAKGLENNVEYADYYHYLLGQAELGRMHKFMHEGSSATAMVAAEQARFHLSQVRTSNSYTSLWKRANALVGEAEITIGEIHLRAKHKAKAQQYLENGFQRLSQVNQLALVSKVTIVSYAMICDKKQTDICTSWVAKLAPFVARSEASRIFERIASFKKPYIDRTVQIPYKIDLDLQAFQKGFTSYLDAKYDEAFTTWRDLLHDYPRTTIKLRTKFWMGRAAQKSQHEAQAETLFREVIKELPFSYYALMSSWFGGIDLARMMDAEMPLATDETPLLSPADVVHIRRAETLIASAVPELAVLELQDVHATVNMPNEFLVYLVTLNHLAGNHNAAFQMLGELSTRSFQGLFSSYGQKLYFPTARLPLIRELAKEWKVDPLLVLSIVKQESAFNDEATSPANAYGLMQIIGPTARDLDPKVEIMDLFNPLVNVKLGTKYVRQLLNRYKGSIIPALCAYNAGPGHSDRWMRESRSALQPEEYIELIGFRETREYVQNITRNYYWYTRRIKHENFPNLLALTQFIVTKAATGASGTHAGR